MCVIISFAYTYSSGYSNYTISGLGSGMVKLSAFTACYPYFNKKKALAIGLATSGSGVGTIAPPLLLRFLFDNYSFSGAIILYGMIYSCHKLFD